MEQIPCTCGGENSNCYKCSGTGMVGISQARTVLAPKPPRRFGGTPVAKSRGRNGGASKISTPQMSERDACPHVSECQSGGEKVLGRGSQVCPASAASSVELPISATPRCQICQVEVPKHMDRHMRKTHGIFPLGKTSSQPLPAASAPLRRHPSYTPPGNFKCSWCNAVAETQRVLDAHCASVHPELVGGTEKLALSDRRFGREIEENLRGGDTRDATRGWGGSFRDHGQFGSHAGYDPMDDESAP